MTPYCKLVNFDMGKRLEGVGFIPFLKLKMYFIYFSIDETLPNFIKRKHPRKGKTRT
jgi:hypothetical protein